MFVTIILSFNVNADQTAYSQAELQALHDKEQATYSIPITKQQQTLLSKVMQLSKPYQSQAQSLHDQGLKMIPHEKNEPEKVSNVLIFTSLALPKTMFTQLLTQADSLHIPVLIRGILKGGMRPTIQALSGRLMKGKDKPLLGGVSIDPRGFKQFGITHVPAFVVVKSGKCDNRKQTCEDKNFDVVYGSMSVSNALDILARKGRFGDEIHQIKSSGKIGFTN
ncbi:type-F conjugative transfer system pilin assembly protein TrbC [Vibrio sp. S11_S32]|uniref:type-F conjugative transfer system pilin assembly protein TrbC n=1 Tax=Vibrio sp. S11_S32 TaxID=2720225 RepID=UPI001680D4F7|nr:type-F conjugative transfer system pilin assembly protein TrbC [Vibrio sp. S11_S32]MBD1576956.1 type-F conjugative transfer system pilin assembly protein TrbC [Vibrio sp. S11_S32]